MVLAENFFNVNAIPKSNLSPLIFMKRGSKEELQRGDDTHNLSLVVRMMSILLEKALACSIPSNVIKSLLQLFVNKLPYFYPTFTSHKTSFIYLQ